MYILTRYVVWEVLKLFLAALIALTLIVTPVMAIKEGMSQGFPALIMLRIMPFILPEMLGITIPASMLFAVCSVFGRMTGANEVVALKSLGISPMAAVWPALVLAAFLSLGTVWMYELAATWCKPTVLRIGCDSIEEIVYGMLQKNRSCDRGQFPFSVTVKRVDPAKPGEKPKLVQPTITIKGPPKVTISAAEATLNTDWTNRKLQLECTQGEFDFGGRGRVSFFGKEQFSVPIPTPDLDRYHRDWVAMRDIPNLIVELQRAILGHYAALRQLEQTPEANAEQIAGKNAEIEDCQFKIRRLRAEPYRRWANGFTCLCFALLGAPVAMLWRHADVLTNFFVCFLPILAIYYPLLMLSDDLSTSGKMPPISFWTANVVLTVPALGLLRWIVRH
jgi:lipopolysaccharide export system permease protein